MRRDDTADAWDEPPCRSKSVVCLPDPADVNSHSALFSDVNCLVFSCSDVIFQLVQFPHIHVSSFQLGVYVFGFHPRPHSPP